MAAQQIANLEAASSVRTKLNHLLLGGVSITHSLASGASTITPTARLVTITGIAASGFDITITNGTVVGEVTELEVGNVTLNGTVRLIDASAGTIVGSIRANHVYRLRWSGATWLNGGRWFRNINPGGFSEGEVIPASGDLDFSGTSGGLVFTQMPGGGGSFQPPAVTAIEPQPPVVVTTTPRTLLETEGIEDQRWVLADSGSSVFRVPADAAAGRAWIIENNTSATKEIDIVGDPAGSSVNGVTGGSVFLAAGAGRRVTITVRSNGGTAPTVQVAGDTTETKVLDGDLNANTKEIYGNYSPFQTATGSQAGAASGRSWKLTGNITGVPVANGWHAKYINVSGSNKTITPASGTCVVLEAGATAASVTVANNKGIVAHGDGTNLIIEGDVL